VDVWKEDACTRLACSTDKGIGRINAVSEKCGLSGMSTIGTLWRCGSMWKGDVICTSFHVIP